ncbi:hypothetical protein HOD83_00575 [Candidatus Woesearchaeota archaeon]|jgi:hypothetical protein|nr:hypothetical protein [Candidatus Woesearchaeota archaeon]MBT4114579.1 hypothetical protein [Candidatus Woesearchaeota archaeon]MBT4248071.1 hypothetical protein [Candidatus Woesearchaeota archaeon]
MNRKRKMLTGFLVMLITIVILAGMVYFMVVDAMENPLHPGERFGPAVHVFSRVFPLTISAQESTSFQGLTGPRSQPDKILVYDVSRRSEEERIQARVAQGLLNRDKPTLYLLENPQDKFWLSQLDYESELVLKLDYSGYPRIKYDPTSTKQKYLAITLAGVHDAMPVTDGQDLLYDLTILSDNEIHNLMLETSNHTNKQLISFRSGRVDHIDFIVKNRMFLSPLALHGTTILPVSHKSESESKVIREIFSKMEPDCLMVGYNINSGIPGEVETINFLSQHGCSSIPIPRVPNLSFFSSLPRAEPTHTTEIQPIKLENKTYIVLLMSDGDNLDLPYKRYGSFGQEHTTPLTWSISPLINEFSPTMFDYYSSNLQQIDSFVVAPSGGGFVYPSKHRYLPAFIEHTDKFMQELNLDYIWLLDHPTRGYSPELLGKFAEISDGLFMEYVILRTYEQSIEMYNDTPAIFSAAFIEKEGNIAQRVVQRTPQRKPAFLVVSLEMRYNTPEHIDSEIARLDSELYEVVSAPDFFALLQQSNTL